MRGCRCSPVGARLLIRQQKIVDDYEKRIHAGQRRVCVGHLAQSSHPQTVSAVWERDQWPAEKWSSQGQTSRTGDTASELVGAGMLSASFSLNLLTTNDTFWCHLTLAACYQLAQSVLKIGSVLAERVGQGEVGRCTPLGDSAGWLHGSCCSWL